MADNKKAVLCFSGGLDSTVLLHLLKAEGFDVYALCVNYGQRHKRELDRAYVIAGSTRFEVKDVAIIDLSKSGVLSLIDTSSQTNENVPVPEGHYEEESMKATVVPNRNMVLLSLATAWAVSLKAEVVAYAAHAGDHAIYPDCRPEFVAGMRWTIHLCDWHHPELYTPFIARTKAEIVRLGYDLGQECQDAMALSYSCYKGSEVQCGRCGTCVERKMSFALADVPDPTEYENDDGKSIEIDALPTSI